MSSPAPGSGRLGAARRALSPPPAWARWLLGVLVVLLLVCLACFGWFGITPAGDFMTAASLALVFVVMALGLNVVVGFAGLLDLGYVAFFALGGYTMGWLGSAFFERADVHLLVSGPTAQLPGIHVNFLVLIVVAMALSALAAVVVGLPALRVRRDYLAITTLAFGEVVYEFVLRGAKLHVFGSPLTAGPAAINPVDQVTLPLGARLTQLDLRPWFYLALALALLALFVSFRLRGSRLGRAWALLRAGDDEGAASTMGTSLTRTKLLTYAVGAAFGGAGGLFHAALLGTVDPDDFQLSFSIFVLAMVVLGGLGRIWRVTLSAVVLAFVNYYAIGKLKLPGFLHSHLRVSDLRVGIFGLLLVVAVIVRPTRLLPGRGRSLDGGAGPAERS